MGIGELTVVCIEIDTSVIKMMALEERQGGKNGVRGEKI
jgi:hypothetical protein